MCPTLKKKESFCLPKGVLLPSKTSPFTTQKDPILIAKGVLLKLCCYCNANKNFNLQLLILTLLIPISLHLCLYMRRVDIMSAA